MKCTIIALLLIFVFLQVKGQFIPADSIKTFSPLDAEKAISSTNTLIGCHIITLAPYGLVSKVRIRYEYVASNRFTIGIQYSQFHFFNNFPGLQLVGIGRLYLSRKHAPIGFYLMAQAGLAHYRPTAFEGPFNSYQNGVFIEYTSKNEVISYGSYQGFGIGYQGFVSKNKRLIIDTYIGIKKIKMNKDLDAIYVPFNFNIWGGRSYANKQFTSHNDLGVGGIINCGINIGYRF